MAGGLELLMIECNRDGTRFQSTEGQVEVADSDLNRIAKRGGLNDADGNARHNAHLHQSKRNRSVASYRDYSGRSVERRCI